MLSGINFLDVIVAALASWFFGAIYYSVLGKAWLAAQGTTAEKIKASNAEKSALAKAFPFILSFVAEVIMSIVISVLSKNLNIANVSGTLGLAFTIWFGFVLTTVAVNNAYPGRKLALTVLDAGHWLGVLMIVGFIIGVMR